MHEVRRSILTAAALSILTPGKVRAQELVADEWSALSEDDQIERRDLKFKTLSNLVKIKDFKTTIIAPGFASTYRTYRGAATMVVSGKVTHPFSTTVRDPIIRLGFLSSEDLELAWRRLTVSPLMLTEHELKLPLPTPSFHWIQDASEEGVFEPGQDLEIRIETKFRDIRLQMRSLPELFVMLDEYSLDDPSPDDLIKIIKHGGVADYAAVTSWAHGMILERPDWPEKERKKLVRQIIETLSTMRPPLKHGDLQGLNALMAMLHVVAQPEDLEAILASNTNVGVLMTSVGLSYYDAVRDELQFDLPVHKIRSLPSLQEFLKSFKHALQEVRRDSIPELVRLAFDPLDFREAPKDTFQVSKVQSEAKQLLEPLTPVNVNQLMVTGIGQPETQKRLLEFFVQARHAPAISTLLHWLHENPEEVEDLGVDAARSMGPLIVPALLRAFLEPRDARERQIARSMLLAIPPEAQPSAVAALRGSGAMLGQDAGIQEAIDAFEHHETQVMARKADLLEQSIFGPEAHQQSAVRRMGMLSDLARSVPGRIEPRAKEIFKLLATVAEETAQSAPTHSARALSLFESLPFGSFKPQARIALILTEAHLLALEGKINKARSHLLKQDPELQSTKIRLRYSKLSRQVIRQSIDTGKFPRASRVVHQAKTHLPHDGRLEVLERELYIAKHKIAFILGGIAGFVTFLGSTYLFARWAAPRLVAWRRRRKRNAGATADGQRDARKVSLEATQYDVAGPPPSASLLADEALDDNSQDEAFLEELDASRARGSDLEASDTSFEDDFDDELDEFGSQLDAAQEEKSSEPLVATPDLAQDDSEEPEKGVSTPESADPAAQDSLAQAASTQAAPDDATMSGSSKPSASEETSSTDDPATATNQNEAPSQSTQEAPQFAQSQKLSEEERDTEALTDSKAKLDALEFSGAPDSEASSAALRGSDPAPNVDALSFSEDDNDNAA